MGLRTVVGVVKLEVWQEKTVLEEIAALKVPRGEAGEAVRKEKNYFAGQSGRMNYKEIAD